MSSTKKYKEFLITTLILQIIKHLLYIPNIIGFGKYYVVLNFEKPLTLLLYFSLLEIPFIVLTIIAFILYRKNIENEDTLSKYLKKITIAYLLIFIIIYLLSSLGVENWLQAFNVYYSIFAKKMVDSKVVSAPFYATLVFRFVFDYPLFDYAIGIIFFIPFFIEERVLNSKIKHAFVLYLFLIPIVLFLSFYILSIHISYINNIKQFGPINYFKYIIEVLAMPFKKDTIAFFMLGMLFNPQYGLVQALIAFACYLIIYNKVKKRFVA